MKAANQTKALPGGRARRRPSPDNEKKAATAEVETPFDRRYKIIREAANLFGTKGFEVTSVRDIAAASGILSGSLYYHFTSKEEIFVAVHGTGMEVLINGVKSAIETVDDPWDRLAAAAAAHCTALLENGEFMVMVVPKFPDSIGDYRDELVRQRDEYERIIADLIAALDLPAGVDRQIFRLHFLGALNWTQTWYRPGARVTPADIGQQLVAMLRPRPSAEAEPVSETLDEPGKSTRTSRARASVSPSATATRRQR